MKFRMLLALVPVIGAGLVYAAPSQAQATRTWVSGVGDDVNPCSRTAPCKTFAGAISKTAAKGEINCLDSAGFGTLTVTKSITVLCEGVVGGVLSTGTNGFTINTAATTDTVILSGLDIDGSGSGLAGVRILKAGRVIILNSRINGFQNGITTPSAATVEVNVENTTISNNSVAGININPTAGGNIKVTAANVGIYGNPIGAVADASLTTLDARLTLKDSVVSGSTTYGVQAIGSSGSSRVFLDSNNISYNGVGIFANGSNTKIFALDNVISNNTTGVSAASGGQTNSYSNNALAGNSAGGTFTNTVLLQ
jgi:hypothetical protein